MTIPQHSSDHVLELYPWRDGIKICLNTIEEHPYIKHVSLIWNESDVEFNRHSLSKEVLGTLLESIGEGLQDLESLSVHFRDCKGTSLSLSSSSSFCLVKSPPISAVTTVLASNDHIRSLTLIGLDFLEDDCLDMNGLIESIRIHPTLHSLVVHKCIFGNKRHLEKLKTVSYERTREERWSWKHLDISENIVASETKGSDAADPTAYSEGTWTSPLSSFFSLDSPLFSLCFHPAMCCGSA